MIYPLLPVFLTTVLGAGAVQLGLIEGVAESTAALLKVASGYWTDRIRSRRPFVISGYGLSGLVRPLIGAAAAWPFVLLLRFLDRVGKGVRTSPRDALIADVTPSDVRGSAYGFHRAMDHAGAVVGPLVAGALLYWAHWSLRAIFFWAALPAAVVLFLLLTYLREPAHDAGAPSQNKIVNREAFSALGRPFHLYLGVLFIFTLGNSSDAFLLMRISQAGLSAWGLALLWSMHHVVKMFSTYLSGRLADQWKPRTLILAAWFVFALIYVGFGRAQSIGTLIALFLAYGLYYGFSEPAERVLVSRLAPGDLRGTAFGCFHGVQGLAALPASALFGLVWKLWGAQSAFMVGASLAGLACVLFLGMGKKI